jgi:hypothetical protein
MKTPNFSIERALVILIITLLLANLLLKQCGKSNLGTNNEPKVSIQVDTVWHTKIDTFKVQTLRYKTVYVDKENIENITGTIPKPNDSSKHIAAKVYQDTLHNNDLEIYSYNLVDGTLLKSDIAYKLKVPREITITKTISQQQAPNSGLFLFSEVGCNTSTFDNISLGLQYHHKNKWFVSYRANLNQLQQPTHNVGVGVKLF